MDAIVIIVKLQSAEEYAVTKTAMIIGKTGGQPLGVHRNKIEIV